MFNTKISKKNIPQVDRNKKVDFREELSKVKIEEGER